MWITRLNFTRKQRIGCNARVAVSNASRTTKFVHDIGTILRCVHFKIISNQI